MRILCIAPYHVTGTLTIWKAEFSRRGHHFRYVTLFRSPFGFEEDLCLDLPFFPSSELARRIRKTFYKTVNGPEADDSPLTERPPLWTSPHPAATAFFAIRDRLLSPRIESAIQGMKLDDADIVWLDQGAEFYRDGRTVARWGAEGKPMMAFYHGSDMRNRGIYPQIDRHLGLRLTSEVDLLHLDERLEYLFLPYDTQTVTPDRRRSREAVRAGKVDPDNIHPADGQEEAVRKSVRIAHAARVRAFKGTDSIIAAVERLRVSGLPVELDIIENVPHEEAMRRKAAADIYVDQIADTGGWGYGMSSIEALAMGLPVCTRMNPSMQAFVPDHPFVHVEEDTLEKELERLVLDPVWRRRKGDEGRKWVVRRHDIRSVADSLLGYWEREGWLKRG